MKEFISEIEKLNNDSETKFRLKITDAEFYHKSESIEIKLPETEQLAKNVEVLGLKELYDNHRDIAVEMVQKQYMYSDEYLETLYQQYERTLFKNMEQLKGLIYGNYISDEEIPNRPLSKLTRDIAEELGLL